MDRIFIAGLRVDSTIGIYQWEQQLLQPLIFDIEMGYDVQLATQSDDITHTLDYEKISQSVIKFVSENKFGLVERVAQQVADLLMQDFYIPWLRIKVTKPNALSYTDGVGVILERGIPLA